MSRSTKAQRIALLAATLTLALAAPAGAVTVIHFEREALPALKLQLRHHEVHALTFHPTPAPGHVHISLNDGRHFTATYAAGEQARLLALARADGTPVAVATVKPKTATAVHHTLRYIAAGIVIVVILVVAAVLLFDRRRKLNEQAAGDPTPPTQSQPSQ